MKVRTLLLLFAAAAGLLAAKPGVPVGEGLATHSPAAEDGGRQPMLLARRVRSVDPAIFNEEIDILQAVDEGVCVAGEECAEHEAEPARETEPAQEEAPVVENCAAGEDCVGQEPEAGELPAALPVGLEE